MTSEWAFLIDENLERGVANKLEQEGFRAELVVDVLGPGAEDLPDVLPYAVENDMIVVTKDVSDFHALDYDDHEGIILVRDHRYSSFQMATGILEIVEGYATRDDLRHREYLDEWID